MQNEKPTPRTDAESVKTVHAYENMKAIEVVDADFARQLERELAEAQEAIKGLLEYLGSGCLYQCSSQRYKAAISRAKKAAGMEEG